MARQSNRLTAVQVRSLKKPGRYGDGHNLYLQITDAGAKSWLLRYARNGRERWLGLGPLHTFSLAEARDRARRARQQIADGIDPIEQRRSERAERALEATRQITFEAATKAYYAQHEVRWTNAKHRENFLSSLRRYAFPIIGRLNVSEIDTGLVLRVLEPIWTTKNETASKLRQRMQAVLDWATVRGHRTGENPARWRGHLNNVLPAPGQVQNAKNYPAMRYEDVPVFMPELRERQGVAARALEFLILTAARTNEVVGATWAEIDLDGRTWTIPAARMGKTGKPHRVPLVDRAVDLLNELPRERGNDFVFVSPMRRGAGLSNMAMATVLKKIHAAREKAGLPRFADRQTGTLAVPHGFRSSFRDWAAERTSAQNHIVEMSLSHQVGNAVERAYRRGDLLDKRRRLMESWSAYCTSRPASADVVPIGRRVG
ncbi:MAG: integrase arm-type DNA-binding domain-containing protein [Hyphomicrobiaceae bacterium]|nr:integrase arm-type DNA-binding domain-containing protein [Hyphomicrobiaceae bacterium]